MAQRIEIEHQVMIGSTPYAGAGTNYYVHANNGAIYFIHINVNLDIVVRKSYDEGITWAVQTVIHSGTCQTVSVWYDRWSGLSTDLIHIAWQESVGHDTLYRTINTASSDALSTQTTIFAGASVAAGGCLSIVRSRGGNVYCATTIDAGTEGGFFRLLNANVPNGAWDAARATVFEAATSDQIILVPGFAADNQDIMAIFWDASADELSRKIYDDSANSWAETSIATSMVDMAASSGFPNFAATVDLTNSRIWLAAWSAADAANADLRCWRFTESAITEVTNIVLNSVDDQALVSIAIDTADANKLVAFYGGNTDGSDLYPDDMAVYRKVSLDAGVTWGAQEKLTNTDPRNDLIVRAIRGIWCIPRTTGNFLTTVAFFNQTVDGNAYAISLDVAGTELGGGSGSGGTRTTLQMTI